MSFPTDTEATLRRRLLQICQDYSRVVVDIVRELILIVDEASNDNMKKLFVSNYYEKVKNHLFVARENEIKSIGFNNPMNVQEYFYFITRVRRWGFYGRLCS